MRTRDPGEWMAAVRALCGVVVAAVAALRVGPAAAVLPTADTYLAAPAHNVNAGGRPYLRVKGATLRTILRFDPAEIRAARGDGELGGATLRVFVESESRTTEQAQCRVGVHAIGAAGVGWTEDGATWACADAAPAQHAECRLPWQGGTFESAPTATTAFAAAGEWMEFDVTADVRAGTAPGGWLLKCEDEAANAQIRFASREGREARRPQLLVRIASPAATVTVPAVPTTTPVDSPTEARSVTPEETATHTSTEASRSPAPSDTPEVPAWPTQTATDTPPPVPQPTEPPPGSATGRQTPSQTALPPAPPATDSPTRTSIPSVTATEPATATPSPTPTPRAGLVTGQVFDDATALPLPEVRVRAADCGRGDRETDTRTDADGRYAFVAAPGTCALTFDAPGYTRAWRRRVVMSAAGARVRDARLTPLGRWVLADAAGAVRTAYRPSVDAGALPVPMELVGPFGNESVRLTPLGPQGLAAPVPLGWSVLLGIDVETAALLPAEWRIPVGGWPAGAELVAATWDDARHEWLAVAAPAAVVDDGKSAILNVPVRSVGQWALLVADSPPNAPPPAVAGAPLAAAEPGSSAAPSARVAAHPDVIVVGDRTGTDVGAALFSAASPPSGAVLEMRLDERYELADGRQVPGATSRQDLAVYRVGLAVDPTASGAALAGSLRVVPSRGVEPSELIGGRIAVTLALPDALDDTGVVGSAGGTVNGPDGWQAIIPERAVDGEAWITLAPGAWPAGANAPSSLIAVATIGVAGSLDPLAPLILRLGSPVPDGAPFFVGRLTNVDGRWVWLAIAFAHGVGGGVRIDPCAGGVCLPGVSGSGTYAVFAAATAPAVVTGTVRAGGVAAAGVLVESDAVVLAALTDAVGSFVLPLPLGYPVRLRARDDARDREGWTSVTPRAESPPVAADVDLLPVRAEIVGVDPPNHAAGIDPRAVVTLAFSEPLGAASLLGGAAVSLFRVEAGGEARVPGRLSLDGDGARLVLTPAEPLVADALYRLRVTGGLVDRTGDPVWFPGGVGTVESDFATAPGFPIDRARPGALRVSLPDVEARVVVCAGTNLAVPGDDVIVRNEATGLTRTVWATGADGRPGSDWCASCAADTPGSFCAIVDDTGPGDRLVVIVRDAFGVPVAIDAPPMRDERTGATVVGAAGGTVTAPAPDEAYRIVVPAGAFDGPTVVTVVPVGPERFPSAVDNEQVSFVAGVTVDFGGRTPRVPVDLAVPGPDDASVDDGPFLVVRVADFRGAEELTPADVAYLDAAAWRMTTEDAVAPPVAFVTDAELAAADDLLARVVSGLWPAPAVAVPYGGAPTPAFPGVGFGGTFGVLKPRSCFAFVTGWAAVARHEPSALMGPLSFVPFPLLDTSVTKYTVPVVCDEPIRLTLGTLDDTPVDFLSFAYRPRKGQFVFTERRIGGERTPPVVLGDRVSPSPPEACDPSPCPARQVGHDAEVSIPFSEPVAGTDLAGADLLDRSLALSCRQGGVWRAVHGSWAQSSDGRRVYFGPRAGRPAHGLPLGTECKVVVTGGTRNGVPVGVRDRNRNALAEDFEMRFETFRPRVTATLGGISALSVSGLGWLPRHSPARQRQYAAVGEGESARVEGLAERGGVVIADVTDPLRPVIAGAAVPTAGMDWAVRYVEAEDLRSADGERFTGPYLMTAEGPGVSDPVRNKELFGVWHLLDFADWPASGPRLVFSRLVSQSQNSFAALNSRLPVGDVDDANRLQEFQFLQTIDNWVGLPQDLANLGVRVAYLANPWQLGVQAITMDGFATRDPHRPSLPKNGSDGRVTGDFRSVAMLKRWVVGAEQNGLVVSDAGLEHPAAPVPALWRGIPVMSQWVVGLADWPVDLDGDGTLGAKETFDLVVVPCNPRAPDLCVTALGPGGEPPALAVGTAPPNGHVLLPPDSQPDGAVVDPIRRLLFVANAGLGVTVVDLQDPRGELDDDEPFGVDDRVLYTVPLPGGARARRIDVDVDEDGRSIGYVATADHGLVLVDLGPARMEVRLEGIPSGKFPLPENRVEIDTVRYYNERPWTSYEPSVRLPGHLAERFPDAVDVVITALDRDGEPVVPPTGARSYAPAEATVSLPRIAGTDRYRLNPGDAIFDGVVVSNLSLDEIREVSDGRCPSDHCTVIYGGIGGSIRLAADVRWSDGVGGSHLIPLEGRVRDLPLESVGVVLLGLDGVRQDVFYPEGREDVRDPDVAARIRLDAGRTPGFAEIMGGVPLTRLGSDASDVDEHSLRIRGASAVFPSITLASWASVESGRGPVDTGELGNEFFDRREAGTGNPGVPGALHAPAGMVTYSNGAFPGYDTFSVSEKRKWDFIPPADPSPMVTPQNRRWQAASVFQQLVDDLPGYGDRFGPVIVEGAHYGKGADRWLTVPDGWLDPLLGGGSGAGWDCYRGDEYACSVFTDRNFFSHLDDYLGAHAAAWREGAERFPGLLMLYQMGPDHVAHDRGLGVDYRRYLSEVTGAEILRGLRSRLIDIEQYYNKIFVIVSDHGHTETGAIGEREEWTEANRGSVPDIDATNRHMHIDEFGLLMRWIGKASSPVRLFHLLHPLEARNSAQADLVVAFDGPMAHVYLRGTNLSGQPLRWTDPPCQADRDAVGNGIVAALGGAPASFGWSNDFNAEIARLAPELRVLRAAVDFVLVRTERGYVVRKPGPLPMPTSTPAPSSSPTPPPTLRPECAGKASPPSSIQELTLEEYFAPRGKMYVDAMKRIERLNHLDRAGDVVIVFRSLTDDFSSNRYSSSGNIPSWHGSLNRGDSYVPFVVSYPGGNAGVLREFTSAPEVCGAATAPDGAPLCEDTLKLAPLVRRILCSQIEGAECDAPGS